MNDGILGQLPTLLARISHTAECIGAAIQRKPLCCNKFLSISRICLDLHPLEGREVVAAFEGGAISSDAGALLLGAADRVIAMMDRLASCFHDVRRLRRLRFTRAAIHRDNHIHLSLQVVLRRVIHGQRRTYATTTEYVFNGDTLVSTVDQQFASGVATGTAQTSYIHPDHLGSTNIVPNASGTVVQTPSTTTPTDRQESRAALMCPSGNTSDKCMTKHRI